MTPVPELLTDLHDAARHVAHEPGVAPGLIDRIADGPVRTAFPDWSFKRAVDHFITRVYRIDEATAKALEGEDLEAFKAEVEKVIGSIERHIQQHSEHPDSREVHLAEAVYQLRQAMEAVVDGYSADPGMMRPPGSNR